MVLICASNPSLRRVFLRRVGYFAGSGRRQAWQASQLHTPLQAIAAALRRAFHNSSTMATMFSRFHPMPLRNAAA